MSPAYAGNIARDYLTPIQAALFKRLQGLKLAGLGSKTCAVYDAPPDDAKFPCVFIGEQSIPRPWNTKTEGGGEADLLVFVRSRSDSNLEVNDLANTILLSLTTEKLDLSEDGLNIVHQQLGLSRVGKIRGWGTIREVRVALKVEDTSTVQPHQ